MQLLNIVLHVHAQLSTLISKDVGRLIIGGGRHIFVLILFEVSSSFETTMTYGLRLADM